MVVMLMMRRKCPGPNVGRRVLTTRSKSAASSSSSLTLRVALPTGIVAGAVSALSGVGGGIILIPILKHFTSLSQHVINGTSLTAITVGASVGVVNYVGAGACNIPIGTILASFSVLTTALGVRASQRISGNTLTRMVGLAMLGMVPIILTKSSSENKVFAATKSNMGLVSLVKEQFQEFHSKILQATIPNPLSSHSFETTPIAEYVTSFLSQNSPYICAGLLSGFLSGLLGLGGGILMTTYLTATSTELSQSEIIGTSLFAIVPIGFTSAYHNIRANNLHLPSALKLGIALSASVYITSKYVALEIPQDALTKFFGGTLALGALSILKKTL